SLSLPDALPISQAVRARRRRRRRARPAPAAARRPRAELLDVHRQDGRLVDGESLRVRRGGRLRARGAAPWRRERGRHRAAHAAPRERREAREVRRAGQEAGLGRAAHGLRASRLQELRSARKDHQGRERRAAREARHPRSAARPGAEARGGRAVRSLLHRAQALPERRLLQRDHHAGDRHPDEHVHGHLRDRAPARLDRTLARGPDRRLPDRSAAAGLRRPDGARVRADRRARLRSRYGCCDKISRPRTNIWGHGMQNGRYLRSLTVACAALALSSAAHAAEWKLIKDTSRVSFTATQQGSEFTGRFAAFDADITFDPGAPESGRIVGTVETASVNSRDSDRDVTMLDRDWFDVMSYPESRFESERIEAVDD